MMRANDTLAITKEETGSAIKIIYVYIMCVLPENNDLLRCILPPLVLLEADVTAVLSWVESSCDSSTQVSQGPVEVVVQQVGGCFK